MVVLSDPLAELVGHGQQAKYVTECKELFLGKKGIEKIRGFERLVNLECLWINGNKLKKLNNLDANFRIKTLYAQDNQICTLKGSLEHFKFLEQMDLSNNQLRDLEKLLVPLARYKFLTHLNLSGNPCCEEPDYRLHVIHAIPSLRVLDLHVITSIEKRKAAGLIGGDVATLTVAFMQRLPPYDPAWDAKVSERSFLEASLMQEAATTRDKHSVEAWERDQREFGSGGGTSTTSSYGGRGLPPNAGTQRALDNYATMHADELSGGIVGTSGRGAGQSPKSVGAGGNGATGGLKMVTQVLSDRLTSTGRAVPKDSLDLFSLRAQETDLGASIKLAGPVPSGGTIKFDQGRYEEFVKAREAGRGQWDLTKTRVVL